VSNNILILLVGDREIKPKVAELSSTEEDSDHAQNDDNDDENEHEEETFDWYIQQVEPDSESDLVLGDHSLQEYGYGFGFAQQGVFSRLADELGQLLDITDPDGKTHRMRREAAEAKEEEKFDGDHYLCDLYETAEIQQLLRYLAHVLHQNSLCFQYRY
jgi:YD repeat-containing protein